jgi:hypothetical protein
VESLLELAENGLRIFSASLLCMARERNDAWMEIAPLDRLADALPHSKSNDEADGHEGLRISMYLKGTEAIFILDSVDEMLGSSFQRSSRANIKSPS